MRRLVLTMLIAAALFLSGASTASATIHPIMLGWVCGPPRAIHQGRRRARPMRTSPRCARLWQRGVLTFTAEGPVIDLTRPASSHHLRSDHRYRGVGSPWFIHCNDL